VTLARPPFTDEELLQWSRLVDGISPAYHQLSLDILRCVGLKATCGCVMRIGDAAESTACDDDATHVHALPPPMRRKFLCASHAAQYAHAGMPVKELAAAPPEVFLRCWCGAGGRKYNVFGLWYCVCDLHKPPWWARLVQSWVVISSRAANPFQRKPAVDVASLVKAAKEKRR
jgi:hypothetical protein